jgi:hypothetical protein
MKIRASFKQAIYLVTVWLELDMGDTNPVKNVKRVLKAACQDTAGDYCRASGSSHRIGSGRCTHCSAAMQVLRNLVRPESLVIDRSLIPKTAKLCRWNRPSDGEHYDIKVPVWTIVFGQPDPDRQEERRDVVCLRSMDTCATHNPLKVSKRQAAWRDGPVPDAAFLDALNAGFVMEDERQRRRQRKRDRWHNWDRRDAQSGPRDDNEDDFSGGSSNSDNSSDDSSSSDSSSSDSGSSDSSDESGLGPPPRSRLRANNYGSSRTAVR